MPQLDQVGLAGDQAMVIGAESETVLRVARPLVTVTCLALLFALEGALPMFYGRAQRLRHAGRNVALGVINALLIALPASLALYAATQWSQARSLGVLDRLALPEPLDWLLALVLFDAWMYAWHVLNHRVPLLMRFHAVHHSDRELDASSALRFHTGEIALSMAARLVVVPALGVSLSQLLLYEIVLQPVIALHHSNVRFPARLDRWLRAVTVTPRMHWVHHSQLRSELDSNYASVLSIWDRVFGTFRLRDDPGAIEYGLASWTPPESRSLAALLRRPFRRGRRGLDSPTRESARKE